MESECETMITAIIQARMGSTRLPGKTMLPFGKGTLLDFILSRIGKSNYIKQFVVATTDLPDDDLIMEHCEENGIPCYRGNTEDVLERFYMAAKQFDATVIVRITADDPFKTASIIDNAIQKFLCEELDYCSNTLSPTYPEGLDVEVFSMSALRTAYENEIEIYEREHVTPYIWKNKNNRFFIGQITTDVDRSDWRMTIDYPEDYAALLRLQSYVTEAADYAELVEAVETLSEQRIMSNKTKRNESYNAQNN